MAEQSNQQEETSTLTAIFGKERAETMRRFAQKLAAVEDRLAKEYMEEEDFADGKEMRSKGRLHRETRETGFQRDTSFHAGGGSQNKVGGNHCIYV